MLLKCNINFAELYQQFSYDLVGIPKVRAFSAPKVPSHFYVPSAFFGRQTN